LLQPVLNTLTSASGRSCPCLERRGGDRWNRSSLHTGMQRSRPTNRSCTLRAPTSASGTTRRGEAVRGPPRGGAWADLQSKPLKAAPISAALNDRGALTSRGGHGTTARNLLVRAGCVRPSLQIAGPRLAEDHTPFTRDTRGVCCAN